METLLFSGRSIWTMVHGIVLGGAALMGLAAALFSLRAMQAVGDAAAEQRQSRYLAWLMVSVAVMLWLTVIVGTYVTFPPYRATPPEGLTDLARYPRSLVRSNPETAWLHSFAMEIKEHIPWIAAMLATAVAFVSMRYRSEMLRDASMRRMTTTMVGLCLAVVAAVAILGVFINKVAPLE